VSLEPTIHELPRTLEPASQLLLWIDGVGGYLVCLSHRVTLGQASPESVVDIPLLADVSRHHATLQRDPEGYFLEAIRKTQVNGKTTEKVLLRSADRITLGSSCQISSGSRCRSAPPPGSTWSAGTAFCIWSIRCC